MTKRYFIILILGVILIPLIIFLNGCYNFRFTILFISFVLVGFALYKLLCHKISFYYVLPPLGIIYFVLFNVISHEHVLERNPYHYKVIASVEQGGYRKSYYLKCYFDDGNDFHPVEISVNEYTYKSIDGTEFIIVENNRGTFTYEWNPTKFELVKYSNAVYFRDDEEIGNDSYEYALCEHDITYKNFGFNIVQIATPIDNETIVVTKLNGEKDYIHKKNNTTDTFLVYSNINPEFYDGWHICPGTRSKKNIAKIDSSGYGYLFRGKIYSAAETEKNWNLIEKYIKPYQVP